ncbi:ERF family protein [Latilactobacillus sakei]
MAEKKMTLRKKLYQIQKEIMQLQKSNVAGVKYSITSSDSVVSAIRPLMDKWGVMLDPLVIRTHTAREKVEASMKGKEQFEFHVTQKLIMRWVDVNNPDDHIDIPFEAMANDRNMSFAMGQAQTYAEKTFFLKYFHIATNDTDPDIFQKELLRRVPVEETQIEAVNIALDKVVEVSKGVQSRDAFWEQAKINNSINPKKGLEDLTAYDYGNVMNQLNKWINAYEKKNEKEAK